MAGEGAVAAGGLVGPGPQRREPAGSRCEGQALGDGPGRQPGPAGRVCWALGFCAKCAEEPLELLLL